MTQYIIRRLLIAIPILFGVTVINYFIIQMAPGSPADLYIDATSTPEQIAMIRQRMGLDQPIIVQYGKWLWQVLQGNLGVSYSSGKSVAVLLASRIGPTLLLMVTALVVAYAVAIPLGIVAARHRNGVADYGIVGGAFVGISVPHFFLGLLLIFVFAVTLKWLPTGSLYTLGSGGGFVDRLLHLILPVVVLATGIAGNMVRYVRASMIDVFSQDYIRTARAKGLSPRSVVYKHTLRNALNPIITVAGIDVANLIGGAIVTEQVFQWPGLGQLTITAISTRDYPVLMGINLLAAVAVVLANLLADIGYAIADPRIKYS